MEDLTNLKAHIDAEYGAISALIAKHPKLAVVVSIIAAYFSGALLKGWPL